MRLLIDTHVFVWLNDAPEQLSPKASEFCGNRDNELYLSLVSPWEMQIKAALGKLHLDVSIREMCETQERDNGLKLCLFSRICGCLLVRVERQVHETRRFPSRGRCEIHRLF